MTKCKTCLISVTRYRFPEINQYIIENSANLLNITSSIFLRKIIKRSLPDFPQPAKEISFWDEYDFSSVDGVNTVASKKAPQFFPVSLIWLVNNFHPEFKERVKYDEQKEFFYCLLLFCSSSSEFKKKVKFESFVVNWNGWLHFPPIFSFLIGQTHLDLLKVQHNCCVNKTLVDFFKLTFNCKFLILTLKIYHCLKRIFPHLVKEFGTLVKKE